MTMPSRHVLWSLAAWAMWLGACAHPAPTWQHGAFRAMERYVLAYFDGNDRTASYEWDQVQSDISHSAEIDWMVQAALRRCATHVASLEYTGCAEIGPYLQNASQRAYWNYLRGAWQNLDAALLPAHHRAVWRLAKGSAVDQLATLQAIEDPLARLVAAGAFSTQRRWTVESVALLVDTASQQGWRRPLLAWLYVQRGMTDASSQARIQIQQRIDLVLRQSPSLASSATR